MRREYDKWLGPGTIIFDGNPDFGHCSSGTIPSDTEVKVHLAQWPTEGDLYVFSRVRHISMLVTDPNHVIGPNTISLGGMTISLGSGIYVRADAIRRK